MTKAHLNKVKLGNMNVLRNTAKLFRVRVALADVVLCLKWDWHETILFHIFVFIFCLFFAFVLKKGKPTTKIQSSTSLICLISPPVISVLPYLLSLMYAVRFLTRYTVPLRQKLEKLFFSVRALQTTH